MILDELRRPVVLAPMAGGPSTPELAAAVSNAGGLGFLAGGYLPAAELAARLARTRSLTAGPVGVNLFVPGLPSAPSAYEDYVAALGPGAGAARWEDDDRTAKLAVAAGADVVSFTFGCPAPEVLAAIPGEVWGTVTSPAEAAQVSGADVLVAQGLEAGGHQGSFADSDEGYGLLALLQLIRSDLPVVAAGGLMTAASVAAVLAAGARAAQLGTAFLLCPEAGTHPVHRAALTSPAGTAVTRAFTGRLARGVRNRFMADHPAAPSAYPEIHHATAPLRAAARAAGDPSAVNLWAGQGYPLARELPAADLVRALSPVPRSR